VTVPEAAVDEDGRAISWEHDIRPARQILSMEAETEAQPVPLDDCFWLDDEEALFPIAAELSKAHPKQPVDERDFWLWLLSLVNGKLLPQGEIFSLQVKNDLRKHVRTSRISMPGFSTKSPVLRAAA
jgi:hypothetical protein